MRGGVLAYLEVQFAVGMRSAGAEYVEEPLQAFEELVGLAARGKSHPGSERAFGRMSALLKLRFMTP